MNLSRTKQATADMTSTVIRGIAYGIELITAASDIWYRLEATYFAHISVIVFE
jgi:hypothetical protein